MDLATLRGEVRDLIGYGAYDRLFSEDMANDAIDFACSQAAGLLGLTRIDVVIPVTNNQVALPIDTSRVIGVQVSAAGG